MKSASKVMKFFPLMFIPIQMTFPVAFNLYWISFMLVQLAQTNAFRADSFRKWINLPDYLPGTKLEAMHAKPHVEVIKPTVLYKTKPLKLAKD